MGPAEHIERRGHVVGFREAITDAARQHDDAFFSWFDHAKDKEASFVRGSSKRARCCTSCTARTRWLTRS